MKKIKFYKTQSGKFPFKIWLEGLKDKNRRARINVRLMRVEENNFGDYKPVAKTAGLYELRFFNDGTRIYYAQADDVIVVIFNGGGKSRQSKEITVAKTYHEDYKKRGEKSYE